MVARSHGRWMGCAVHQRRLVAGQPAPQVNPLPNPHISNNLYRHHIESLHICTCTHGGMQGSEQQQHVLAACTIEHNEVRLDHADLKC